MTSAPAAGPTAVPGEQVACEMFIAGEWTPAASSETFAASSPANGAVIGSVAWRHHSWAIWLIYPCAVFVLQGAADKLLALRRLLGETGVTAEQVCYVGDDLPDLPPLRHCARRSPTSTLRAQPRITARRMTLCSRASASGLRSQYSRKTTTHSARQSSSVSRSSHSS